MSARYHALILSSLFFCVHLVLFWHYGIRVLWDSAAYIEAADFVVANGNLQDIHHLYYSVPIMIMAAFRVLFPETLIPILLFQCLLSGIATIALYKSAEKVFSSKQAGLMAGVIFIIWLDNVHWNTTTMTESITRSIFCFVVYVVANWKNRLRDAIALALLMIVVFFTRPTGVIPVIGAFAFVIVYNWKSLVEKPPRLIAVALISTAAILFGADRMLAHWDFTGQYLKGNVVTFADLVQGPLFHETLTVEPPSSRAFAEIDSPVGRVVMFIFDNPVHFLKTAGLKIFYLIAFVRPYYSWAHNLYLVVWTSLIYIFVVIGWRATSNMPIKFFVLTTIILNCGLIGISSVDWDNRFYIPMEPGIVLLAAGGAAALLNRIGQKSLSMT